MCSPAHSIGVTRHALHQLRISAVIPLPCLLYEQVKHCLPTAQDFVETNDALQQVGRTVSQLTCCSLPSLSLDVRIKVASRASLPVKQCGTVAVRLRHRQHSLP